MLILVNKKYIWFAVGRECAERKLCFYSDGELSQELDIRLSPDDADFYFAMDVERFMGKQVEIREVVSDEVADNKDYETADRLDKAISLHDEKPSYEYKYRPRFHFTAEAGWINDPNGLIYADGVYHMYYQWNPYGIDWGNMHWGHAVSRDLINWEHRPLAMEPDEYGTIYSGCAICDKENAAGFGKDALLYFYTASGGRNNWSKEMARQHVQRLAVSTDGGETLEKKCTVLEHKAGENRDPLVFYHEKSEAYIMVLYLDGNEFAIYRSDDMLHWTESQRFTADKMWECPGLFELENKWVFWSADGYYMIGDFDGYKFTPESEVLAAYETTLPYAAQIYAGVEDRTISVAWYRTKNNKGGFRGMMSIPMELSLRETDEGLRIAFAPVGELWDRFDSDNAQEYSDASLEYNLEGSPVAIIIYDTKYSISVGDTMIEVADIDGPTTIIVDHGIIECFSNNGLSYKAIETEEDILFKKITTQSDIKKVRIMKEK
ncbi:MAG: glycoside hydrolase family 32 protein [Eubacterium sp.]|nr:glycoside hydrolase family 32 protein [Eubacterium sp.]